MKIKKIFLSIFLTILFFNQALACLNGKTVKLKNGKFLYHIQDERIIDVPRGNDFASKETLNNGLTEMEELYQKTKNIDYLSDKGLILILLKRYNEAIKLFLEIENKKPNQYSTASNIGTAYELIGNNIEALKWIKKSVEINSKSHNGSEWIHVKILEAKTKGEKYYTTNFLLNTDFGNQNLPASELTVDELKILYRELAFQLNERVSFVKPQEKIVAQLLFDLGNIRFLLGDFRTASAIYIEAQKYGNKSELLKFRLKESDKFYLNPKLAPKLKIATESKIKKVNIKKQEQPSYLKYLFYSAGLIILIFIGTTIAKNKKQPQ